VQRSECPVSVTKTMGIVISSHLAEIVDRIGRGKGRAGPAGCGENVIRLHRPHQGEKKLPPTPGQSGSELACGRCGPWGGLLIADGEISASRTQLMGKARIKGFVSR